MSKISKSALVILVWFCMTAPAYTDDAHLVGIKLDGTFGNSGKLDLPGPDYDIKAEFGKQSGANLFHSFQQFNLHKGESATFSGSDSVQNIITRVSGGNASWIDGKLASNIPNANLYFLNPAGVMFGPNASLDLTGSFHVSTADYLRLGENERFHAMPQSDELLSAAAPKDFGFLNDNPAAISAEGSFLQVSQGKTLSVAGGDIRLNNSNLLANSGQINLTGGEIIMSRTIPSEIFYDVDAGGTEEGQQGGTISIHAEYFELRGGSVSIATNYGDAGRIDIQADKDILIDSADIASGGSIFGYTIGYGNAGTIGIRAENFTLCNGAYINDSTYGDGKGGDIEVSVADTLRVSGFYDKNDFFITSGFNAGSSKGQGGNIRISASDLFMDEYGAIETSVAEQGISGNIVLDLKTLTMTGGTMISASTWGEGHGGDINISAKESISISGKSKDGSAYSNINTNVYEGAAGDGGNLSLSTANLYLKDAGSLSSSTFGTGNGGNILVSASESVQILNSDQNDWTGIWANSKWSATGKGGNITLSAPDLLLDDYSERQAGNALTGSSGIQAGAEGEGMAGSIRLNIDRLTLKKNANILTLSMGSGNSGDIDIVAADSIRMESNASITAQNLGTGPAGSINIDIARSADLYDSSITTDAESAGGGKISFNAGEQLYLNSSSITSSVHQGSGNGGDIAANSKNIVMNKGSITANAEEGDGGAVFIRSENFIRSSESRVEATSARGNQGTVEIQAPDLDIADSLNIMPGNFLDAAKWAITPCRQRSGENLSRFVFEGRDTIPLSFDDWQPSPPFEK